MQQAQRTLSLCYLYAFLGGMQFPLTIWLPYVILKGGDPGWAEAAFHLVILLAEVPTGTVADLWGRRRSMLIGTTLLSVAFAGFVLVEGSGSAMLVMGLWGLASTFLSGADSALLYETAHALGGTHLSRQALARGFALRLAGLAAAPLLAGWLYHLSPQVPFWVGSLVAAGAVLTVAGMAETLPQREDAARPTLWQQTRLGSRAILSNPAALSLVLFYVGYTAVKDLVAQFSQAYFPYAGASMVVAGVIFSVARLFATGASLLSARLEPCAVERTIRFAPLLIAGTILAMAPGHLWLGVPFFVLSRTLGGLLEPLVQHQLQEAVPSPQRATVLSLQSSAFSLVMAVAFPLVSLLHPVTRVHATVGSVAMLLAVVWFAARVYRPEMSNHGIEDGRPGQNKEGPGAVDTGPGGTVGM